MKQTLEGWLGMTPAVLPVRSLTPNTERMHTTMSSNFPVWKKITLGTLSPDQILHALQERRIHVNEWVRSYLSRERFTVANNETVVDLVRVTTVGLGFPQGATTERIIVHAEDLGLLQCSPEVGPQLRLQYLDQPRGEKLRVGTPISRNAGRSRVFLLEGCGCTEIPGSTLLLCEEVAVFGQHWHPGYEWIFACN